MYKSNNTTLTIYFTYTERPQAVKKAILSGYSINDITITRIGVSDYILIANKGV